MSLPYTSVQDWFFAVAARQPQAVALTAVSGSVSYGSLAMHARWITAALAEAGLSPGAIVAIACDNPAEFVTALIGVLAAGGVALPIDPGWPDGRTAQILEIAQPSHGLIGAGGADVAALKPDWLSLRTLVIGEQKRVGEPPALAWSAKADSPCYVFFTSGSTGRPKGIVGRTIGVAQFVDWEIRTFGIGANAVVPMLTSPGFDAVLRDIFTPLCAGGRVALVEDRGMVADAAALTAWLDRNGVTLWHTTPSLLRIVLRCGEAAAPASLGRVLVAGEPLLPTDVTAWFSVFGNRTELVNLYGPSETTMIKLFHRLTRQDEGRARVPIGRPIDGCRAIVLNSAGAPAGVGVVDEIYLRTPYRSLGYLGQPELTDTVFVRNPLSGAADDIVYRTGDLGRMDEHGVFEFFGRVDWQLKVRGVRVEPVEVEAALRRHPDVLDVAVVGHDLGSGNLQLCAYVVLRDGADISGIRGFAACSLVDAMIPTLFVPLGRIPRNVNGKVERAALPDPGLILAEEEFVAPRTPVEQAVVDILRETLEIDKVSVTASFFAIGGHSLLLMQVLSRIEEAFGVVPSLAEVLERPTAETMAAVLEAGLAEQSLIDEELQALIDTSPPEVLVR